MFIGNFPTIIIVFDMIINALWLSHLATPRNRTCIWCLKGRCSCSFSRQDLLGGADPHAIVSLPNQQVIQTMSCGYNSGLTGGTNTCPNRSHFDPRSEIPEKPVEKIKSQKNSILFFGLQNQKNKLVVIVNEGHKKQKWIFLLFYFLRGPAFCFRMECAASGQQLCRKIPPKSANHRSYIFGAFGVPS